jgi:hypothetical protein
VPVPVGRVPGPVPGRGTTRSTRRSGWQPHGPLPRPPRSENRCRREPGSRRGRSFCGCHRPPSPLDTTSSLAIGPLPTDETGTGTGIDRRHRGRSSTRRDPWPPPRSRGPIPSQRGRPPRPTSWFRSRLLSGAILPAGPGVGPRGSPSREGPLASSVRKPGPNALLVMREYYSMTTLSVRKTNNPKLFLLYLV